MAERVGIMPLISTNYHEITSGLVGGARTAGRERGKKYVGNGTKKGNKKKKKMDLRILVLQRDRKTGEKFGVVRRVSIGVQRAGAARR